MTRIQYYVAKMLSLMWVFAIVTCASCSTSCGASVKQSITEHAQRIETCVLVAVGEVMQCVNAHDKACALVATFKLLACLATPEVVPQQSPPKESQPVAIASPLTRRYHSPVMLR